MHREWVHVVDPRGEHQQVRHGVLVGASGAAHPAWPAMVEFEVFVTERFAADLASAGCPLVHDATDGGEGSSWVRQNNTTRGIDRGKYRP